MWRELMIKRIALFLALLCVASVASAHPHVWVTTKLELLKENDKIKGLRVLWGFDEFYSTIFLTEADTNGNKILDRDEIETSINSVFNQEQQELYPFFFMKPAGKKAAFSLKNADVYMDKGTVYYKFDVIFDTPQPLKGNHRFGIYDPEFYVSFDQDLKVQLPDGANCTQNIAEDESISIYYDMVNPEIYTLKCS